MRNWESITLYSWVLIRLEAGQRSATRAAAESQRLRLEAGVKSRPWQEGRGGQTSHSSGVRRRHTHTSGSSLTASRLNKRAASFLCLSLTPPIRSRSWSSDPWTTHARLGDIRPTSPTAGNGKFHILPSLQWQWSFIYAWNCIWSLIFFPFFFFHYSCRRYWRGNLAHVTLHYWKVSQYRVWRERLWLSLSHLTFLPVALHASDMNKTTVICMWAVTSIWIYTGNTCPGVNRPPLTTVIPCSFFFSGGKTKACSNNQYGK